MVGILSSLWLLCWAGNQGCSQHECVIGRQLTFYNCSSATIPWHCCSYFKEKYQIWNSEIVAKTCLNTHLWQFLEWMSVTVTTMANSCKKLNYLMWAEGSLRVTWSISSGVYCAMRMCVYFCTCHMCVFVSTCLSHCVCQFLCLCVCVPCVLVWCVPPVIWNGVYHLWSGMVCTTLGNSHFLSISFRPNTLRLASKPHCHFQDEPASLIAT